VLASTELAMRIDPVLMAEIAGFQLDTWQESVLRSQHPRITLNISRQVGKTSTTALLCLHTVLFEPGSLVLAVSRSLRQSSELFRVALSIYRRLGRPVAPEVENKLSLELNNGSRLISLPGSGDSLRGFPAVRMIAVDESSRVSDDLIAALRPMLATTNGRLIALSTPRGRRGWWYEAWEHGGDDWERYEVWGKDCKRISPEFLAEERRALGPAAYAREYECSFDDDELSVFPEDLIQRCITKETNSWASKIPPSSLIPA
jgi:hypothetical protein